MVDVWKCYGERIPNQEICEHKIFLDKIFKNIQNIKFYTIAGSFRRNAPDSGDIDVIICLHEQDNTFIKIKELALKEKQLKTIQNWMSEKIIETYISVNKDSRECNFANKWLKK